MPAVVPVNPEVSRANVDWTLARMAERVGNEYVYGGQFAAEDINQGCDCSALVAFVCNGVLYGPRATWRRVDGATGAWITTESWRPVEVGEVGPFGSITVASAADIPADAAVKIALHHGPGGGVASHTWCEVDGHRFESNGSRGCVTDPEALAIDSNYANDWAYIPGPIDRPLWEPNNEPAPPACEEPTNAAHRYVLQLGDTGTAVVALQRGLRAEFPAYAGDLEPSGVYNPRTAEAVAEFQRRTLNVASGNIDGPTAITLGTFGIHLTDPTPVFTDTVTSVADAMAPDPQPVPEAEHQADNPAPEPPAAPVDPRPPHHAVLDGIIAALGQLAAMIDKQPPR